MTPPPRSARIRARARAPRASPSRRLEPIEPSMEDVFVAIIEPKSGRPHELPPDPRHPRKEVLHITRDTRSLGMALAMPLLMLLLFGYALTLDVDRIPTLVYDQDQHRASRELVRQFAGSRYFEIRGYVDQLQRHRRGIDRNQHPARRRDPAAISARPRRGGHARRSSCCSTAAIPTPPRSPSAMPRASSATTRSHSAADALNRKGGGELDPARRRAHPRLVQQRARIQELHRARPDRRDPHDHRRPAHLPHHRPRVGDRHHGAVALHARCAPPRSCSASCSLTSSSASSTWSSPCSSASWFSACPSAAASSCSSVSSLHVPVRRVVLGHLPLRRHALAAAGVPGRHDQFLPARRFCFPASSTPSTTCRR